ncbi:MAG TPA: CPBP family glutamic-type intramembrane protease [Gemmatimonadaceae bacterium]|nr:CPBP family glutamic-type intramembrane protease [Gemmatimonadaceae bacterium]
MTAAAEATPPSGWAAWIPSSYLGWLLVAMTFAVTQPWLERSVRGGEARVGAARILATLLCLALAAPWPGRPSGSWPAAGQGSRTAPAWRAVTAVALALVAAVALLVNGGVGALLVAIRHAPAAILFTVPVLAIAEEVYFREALPAALAAVAGDVRWRTLAVAAASQLLYAIAHLPALLIQPSPRPMMLVLASLLRDLLFGLMLLTLVRGPARRVVRVLVHTVVNLSVIVLPPGAGMHAWRGPILCLLAAVVLQLARSARVSDATWNGPRTA